MSCSDGAGCDPAARAGPLVTARHLTVICLNPSEMTGKSPLRNSAFVNTLFSMLAVGVSAIRLMMTPAYRNPYLATFHDKHPFKHRLHGRFADFAKPFCIASDDTKSGVIRSQGRGRIGQCRLLVNFDDHEFRQASCFCDFGRAWAWCREGRYCILRNGSGR